MEYRAWMAARGIDRITRRVEDDETTILGVRRGTFTAQMRVDPAGDDRKALERLADELDRAQRPMELSTH